MKKLMHARKISRDDYGDAWPFTVDEGWLRRCPETDAIRFTVGETTYGLNGPAKSFYGDRDIEPIHAPNLDIPPIENDDGTAHRVRKSVAPVIADGQKIGRG